MIIGLVLLLLCSGAQAQNELAMVLGSVESNNAALKARRELTQAQGLEARTGNSLENPSVSYDHMWGSPSEVGKTGELNVAQSFDFPSSYVYRNRAARAKIGQYGHEYALFRQQMLLQAQSTYIEVVALRQLVVLGRSRMDDARQVAETFSRRFDAGDVSILEKNSAELELINARNTLRDNELALESAVARLTGLNGGVPLVLAGNSLTPLYAALEPLPAREQMLDEYRKGDPALLASMSQVDVAEHEVRVSRAQSLPKFEVGYRHEFALGERFNGVTAGMSIPMFGNRNNVKRAKAQAAYAKTELESSQIDVQTTIYELYARAEMVRSSLDDYSKLQRPADTERLLMKALDAGQITINEYIAERESLLRINEAEVTFMRDYLLLYGQINAIKL